MMKQLACFVSYLGTQLLWVVANPRGLRQTIAQSGGQVLALARRLCTQEQVGEPTAVSFSLPFAAEWLAGAAALLISLWRIRRSALQSNLC